MDGRTMRGRLLYLVPAIVFGVIAGYFLGGLITDRDPRAIPLGSGTLLPRDLLVLDAHDPGGR